MANILLYGIFYFTARARIGLAARLALGNFQLSQ
jgi:hypothetical protein